MSSPVSLSAQVRAFHSSRGQLQTMRRQGWIPAIIYGNQKDPVAIRVLSLEFCKELANPGIRTRVFHLGEWGLVLVKDMQFHPTKDIPIHIDFLRLSDRVVVSVPLKFTHEERSPGLKRGGILNIVHYRLDLSVPSHHIPHEIAVDLTGMDIGQTVPLKEIELPQDVRVLHLQGDETLVSVVAPSGLTESLKGNA